MRRETQEAIFFSALLVVILFPIARRHVRNYLLRPLRLRREGMDETVDYVPFDPAEVPEPVAKALALAAQQLAACGFRAIDHFMSRTVVADATAYLSAWCRDDAGDVASVTIVGFARPRPLTVSIVSIGRDFTDGSSITVSTERFPRPILADPRGPYIRLPEIWDVALLWEVHRRWAQRDAGARTAQVPGRGQLREYLASGKRARLTRMVAAGWCRLNPEDGRYYYTRRGACLTIWRQLWPLRQWRDRRDRQEAEQLLRSLGFGAIDDLIRQQRPIIHDEAGGASIRGGEHLAIAPVPDQAVLPDPKSSEIA